MTRYVQLSLVPVLLSVPLPLLAGSLNSSAAPGSTNSYTIGDICNRLDSGTAGVQIPFREPTIDPAPTGCTLNDIMSKAPVADNTSGALINEVLFGKTFWGLRTDGTWGLQTGTLASQTPTDTTVAQPAGNYSAFNLSTVDTDLATGNVKSGVNIFGVIGTYTGIGGNVQDTSSGNATAADIASGKKAWVNGVEITGTASPAAVAKTGQTICYDVGGLPNPCALTGHDGDKLAGVTWPNPRFTDNSNGTVTDNLTGLIWLKNANCFAQKNWTMALSEANGLASPSCDLSDGSTAGDWRLPNRTELTSLINSEYDNPALSNAAGTAKWSEGSAFSGVQADDYWSSTTRAGITLDAWGIDFDYGDVFYGSKTYANYVWPVRSEQ